MTDREIFKRMCLSSLGDIAELHLSEQKMSAIRSQWAISRLCRNCKQRVEEHDFDIWVSYWGGFWFPAHKACLPHQREEAFECQKIDADCNDCRHFQRGRRWDGMDSFDGVCLKSGEPTTAHVNFCSGRACFEPRRAQTDRTERTNAR